MEMIYDYDGTFHGFLCCIFDSYANKEVPIAIHCNEDDMPTLFPSRSIQTNHEHAERVFRKVAKLSPYAAELLHKGFLTCHPDKELLLYRLVSKLLKDGPQFLHNLSDDTIHPIYTAVRHLTGEVHLLKGFVRFSELGGVLVSEIAPKNRVLPLLCSHFCARYPNETFFIYDQTNREALFHTAGQVTICPMESFEMAPPDETEAHYRVLWKRFYDTIAIQERENPKCRMSNMPMRYWSSMTEFQPASYFTPKNTSSGAPIPAVPNGKFEPEAPPALSPSVPASSP